LQVHSIIEVYREHITDPFELYHQVIPKHARQRIARGGHH
jgi:hypothetical protein